MQKKKPQQQQLATRYQCLKAFLHRKVDEKIVFLELICLYLKKLTLKNEITSIDLCPRQASRNLVLATYILVLFGNVTSVSLFAAKR